MKVTQAIKAPGPCTLILNTDVGELWLTPAKPCALMQGDGWTFDPQGQGESVAIYKDEETEELMHNMTSDPVLVELSRRAAFAETGQAIDIPTPEEARRSKAKYRTDGITLFLA